MVVPSSSSALARSTATRTGPAPADPAGELGAVHLRHDEVAQDELPRAVPPAHQVQRLGAVARLEHGVAEVAQLPTEQGPDVLLIVDDEDDAGAGLVGHERLRRTGKEPRAQRTALTGIR